MPGLQDRAELPALQHLQQDRVLGGELARPRGSAGRSCAISRRSSAATPLKVRSSRGEPAAVNMARWNAMS